jgi:hypothetical protein
MSKMWKPGTSKPKSEALPQKDNKKEDSKKEESGDVPSASSASKKKLSGATMGMRFMARKMEAEEARKKTLKERHEQEQMEWTAEQDNGDGPAEEYEEAQLAQQEATASDMYGLRSDLIGRRSFGGFQPKVNDTWKSAWNEWETKGNASGKKILHISDDELLRRYKNGNVDSTAASAPIGNLQGKLMKGKKKIQSAHRGEKRKR